MVRKSVKTFNRPRMRLLNVLNRLMSGVQPQRSMHTYISKYGSHELLRPRGVRIPFTQWPVSPEYKYILANSLFYRQEKKKSFLVFICIFFLFIKIRFPPLNRQWRVTRQKCNIRAPPPPRPRIYLSNSYTTVNWFSVFHKLIRL